MDTTQAIEALKRALPGAIFAFPGTTEYAAISDQYQSGTTSELTPACFVQPSSAEEVSTFIKTIKPFALNGAAPFAIVGVGQQPAAGCSNIEAPGVTLSLQRLKGISVKDGVVEVAAGESWGPVNDTLVERGLSFSGGRSYRSGIGGLALAGPSRFVNPFTNQESYLLNSHIGGLSFVSSREGFISDNVGSFRCHIPALWTWTLHICPYHAKLLPFTITIMIIIQD